MKYINLLGQEIDTDEELKKRRKINPLVKYYGKGPEDKRCKHCKFFYGKQYAKIYYKCSFRGDTNGPGTDHKANWPTCGKFEEEKE